MALPLLHAVADLLEQQQAQRATPSCIEHAPREIFFQRAFDGRSGFPVTGGYAYGYPPWTRAYLSHRRGWNI
jgi:hypothetical protein